MDIKSPADKHNLVQLGRVLRVWDERTQGSAAVCPFWFAHWPFNILPFETLCSELEEKKKNTPAHTVSTAELIFMVYREYTGISWPEKAILARMTYRIRSPSLL